MFFPHENVFLGKPPFCAEPYVKNCSHPCQPSATSNPSFPKNCYASPSGICSRSWGGHEIQENHSAVRKSDPALELDRDIQHWSVLEVVGSFTRVIENVVYPNIHPLINHWNRVPYLPAPLSYQRSPTCSEFQWWCMISMGSYKWETTLDTGAMAADEAATS